MVDLQVERALIYLLGVNDDRRIGDGRSFWYNLFQIQNLDSAMKQAGKKNLVCELFAWPIGNQSNLTFTDKPITENTKAERLNKSKREVSAKAGRFQLQCELFIIWTTKDHWSLTGPKFNDVGGIIREKRSQFLRVEIEARRSFSKFQKMAFGRGNIRVQPDKIADFTVISMITAYGFCQGSNQLHGYWHRFFRLM